MMGVPAYRPHFLANGSAEIPNRDYEPHWSADGRELFYLQGDAMMVIAAQTEGEFSFASPSQLFSGQYLSNPDPGVLRPQLAESGRRTSGPMAAFRGTSGGNEARRGSGANGEISGSELRCASQISRASGTLHACADARQCRVHDRAAASWICSIASAFAHPIFSQVAC